MVAKRFCYVCAGLFLLALTYHVGAKSAGAQFSPNQEIAVLTGQVGHGQTIPLPQYTDGTQALESECHWIVSVGTQDMRPDSDFMRCTTSGRTVSIYTCAGNCGPAGDCVPIKPGCIGAPNEAAGMANFMIVAVRQTGPTQVNRETTGSVKARYR